MFIPHRTLVHLNDLFCLCPHTEAFRYKIVWPFVAGICSGSFSFWASQVTLSSKESACKNLPSNAGDIRDTGLIPQSGRSPGEGNGKSLQYSCLGNPKGRGTWWATVHGLQRVGCDWAHSLFLCSHFDSSISQDCIFFLKFDLMYCFITVLLFRMEHLYQDSFSRLWESPNFHSSW